MKFIQAKDALVTMLESEAHGEFKVISYESFPKGAAEFTGKQRAARVFYSEGVFEGEAITTPAMHDITMKIELVVVEPSDIDLGVLNDPDATASQRANALSNVSPAAYRADVSMDDLISRIWNIIMNPANQWFQTDKYMIGSRRVKKIYKDRLIPLGEYAILTGFLELSFDVEEIAIGDIPYEFESNNTDFTPIDGDTVQKTGQETR